MNNKDKWRDFRWGDLFTFMDAIPEYRNKDKLYSVVFYEHTVANFLSLFINRPDTFSINKNWSHTLFSNHSQIDRTDTNMLSTIELIKLLQEDSKTSKIQEVLFVHRGPIDDHRSRCICINLDDTDALIEIALQY